MASTANSSFSSPNGGGGGGGAGSGSTVNTSSAPQGPSAARGPMRPNNAAKGSDTGRRQSPGDSGNRRPNNPQRGWSQNTNPMGQKGSGPYSYHNAGGPNRKSTVSPRLSAGKESNTADMHAHDRLTFLFTAFIGLSTTVTTKTGEKFSGILSGSSLESNDTSFVLKMARHYSPEGDSVRPNGISEQASPYLGAAPDHQMVFEAQDVVSIAVPNVSATAMSAKDQNASATFRTDSDISTGNQGGRERELQRWEPSADATVDMSLESTSSAGWDQFETNARLFGATSSYDENLYTTRIDRNDPSYKRKEAEAARIAREIETSQTDNPHLREERGHAPETDTIGEEEKYSGVNRDDTNFPPLQSNQPNKYTPPARRAPTGKPTVPGAPVDPAIISAQVARPKPVEEKTTVATATTKDAEAPKEASIERPKPPEQSTSQPLDTSKDTASGKPDTDSETKKPLPEPGPNDAADAPKGASAAENSGSHVGAEVLDQFRQFANIEKMKLQECRRNQAVHDKTIKLNELMKFSQNFKLGTLVPKDLIPILAKDRNKQEAIVERAKQQHDEKTASSSKPSPESTSEQKQAPPTGPARPEQAAPPAHAAGPADRQSHTRGRPGYPPMGPQAGRQMPHQPMHGGRGGPGMLGHRLADIQQQRKGPRMPVPAPLPIHESRPPPGGTLGGGGAGGGGGDQTAAHKTTPTPTSAVSTKFNARAMEFKPNPAASSFTPAGTSAVSSSPASNARTRSISRAASPSAFFGTKKLPSASARPSLNDHFNPIKRMKTEATEQSSKDYAFNGGIPPAYRTQPLWEVSPMNEDKTYAEMFKGPIATATMASPQGRTASMSQAPHHPQAPFHMQQGNQAAPQSTGPPHVVHPQQHPPSGPPQFDDHHRMQMSASSSQAYPSPRMPDNHQMPYQSPMGHHAQLATGQPMPQYYVPPGPHPPHMRHYPQGPHFGNPQNGMGAPMMVQQTSSGPYMPGPQGMGAPYNSQMQMYSPNPGHAYPHTQPPPQPHSGYPSPSRGAPMMVHQGSQQGHHPSSGMYMNPGQHGQPFYGPQQPAHMPPMRPGQHHPPFNSSPRQAQHYPHQPRGQGNNYNQVPHMPPPHMQSQGPPAAAPTAPAGQNAPDNAEEVK